MRIRSRAKKGVALMLAVLLCLFMAAPAFAAKQGGEEKTVRTAAFESQPGFFQKDQRTGAMSGYAYDYLIDVSDYAGWNVTYTDCGWSEALDKLEAGRIDIMADVSYTKERAQRMLFSAQPMGSEKYYLFVASDSKYSKPEQLNGKTIGVARDSVEAEQFKKYLKSHSMDCTLVTYDSDAEIDGMLESGKIQAFVEVGMQAEAGYVPLCQTGASDYYFAISKDRPDLKKDVDAAMAHISETNPYYLMGLAKKYLDSSTLMSALSPDEKAWVAKNKNLTVGYPADSLPYCSEGEDGAVDGVLAHALNTLKEQYGFESFTCIPYASGNQMAADLKAGKLDAAFGLTDNEWISDTNGLSLCESFLGDTSAVVYTGDYSRCFNGRLAVTETNSFDLPCFQDDLPDAEFVLYGTAEQCMAAVFSGEVDGWIDHSNKVFRTVNANASYRTAKVAGVNKSSSICFCVAKSNSELYRILNHLNGFYTEAEVTDLINGMPSPDQSITLHDFITYNAVPVLVVTILLSIGIIVSILLVTRRMHRLDELSFEDSLTGLGNRTAFEKERAVLTKKPSSSLGVVFADVNGLKESNDREGHSVGDQLIKRAAGMLTACFPKQDIYRLGGDEFVVLQPGCDRRQFLEAFERLVELSSEERGGILSVGCAWEGAEYDIHQMTAEAERQMYQMKRRHYSQRPNDRRARR